MGRHRYLSRDDNRTYTPAPLDGDADDNKGNVEDIARRLMTKVSDIMGVPWNQPAPVTLTALLAALNNKLATATFTAHRGARGAAEHATATTTQAGFMRPEDFVSLQDIRALGGGGAAIESLSPDNGDANKTLDSTSDRVQRNGVPLTATRTYTLPDPTTLGPNHYYKFWRQSTCTGGFPIEIRNHAGTLLFTLAAPNEWAMVYKVSASAPWWDSIPFDYKNTGTQYLQKTGDTTSGGGRLLRDPAVTSSTSPNEFVTKQEMDSMPVGKFGIKVPWHATSTRSYLICNLRPNNTSPQSQDKLFFRVRGGTWWQSGLMEHRGIIYGDDNGVPAARIYKEGYEEYPTLWGIRAYRQGDNSLNVYLSCNPNHFNAFICEFEHQRLEGGLADAFLFPRFGNNDYALGTPAGVLALDSHTWVNP